MKNVLIAIQARSGSSRLPKKAYELIGGKMMLDHVIEACKKAASYIHKREGISSKIIIVTPVGDPIVTDFSSRCDVVEGPLHDVLSHATASPSTDISQTWLLESPATAR